MSRLDLVSRLLSFGDYRGSKRKRNAMLATDPPAAASTSAMRMQLEADRMIEEFRKDLNKSVLACLQRHGVDLSAKRREAEQGEEGEEAGGVEVVQADSKRIRVEINKIYILIVLRFETFVQKPSGAYELMRYSTPPPDGHPTAVHVALRLGHFYGNNFLLSDEQKATYPDTPKGLPTDILCIILSKLVSHNILSADEKIWLEPDESADDDLVKKLYERRLGFTSKLMYGRRESTRVLYSTIGTVIETCNKL